MKRITFQIVLLLLTFSLYSQSFDEYIKEGIKLHDNGKYKEAINAYQNALKIDPDAELVHYEMSLTYMYLKDYNNSIKHADKVIEAEGEHMLPAIISKGSCLDYIGETKKSIKLFKKGLRKYGSHYLLNYNLAYTYYRINEIDKAIKQLEEAINNNPNHSSSHYLLGLIMSEQNQRVQSLLSLHYFLFLEPGSERSKTAYQVLMEQFHRGVSKDENDPTQITINIDPDQKSEFRPANMMISMLGATNFTDENKDKTSEELFIKNTDSFFSILGELNQKKLKKSLWWDFYVPFFYKLAQSDHMETYCHYISFASNDVSQNWIENNKDKIHEFDLWLNSKTE